MSYSKPSTYYSHHRARHLMNITFDSDLGISRHTSLFLFNHLPPSKVIMPPSCKVLLRQKDDEKTLVRRKYNKRRGLRKMVMIDVGFKLLKVTLKQEAGKAFHRREVHEKKLLK